MKIIFENLSPREAAAIMRRLSSLERPQERTYHNKQVDRFVTEILPDLKWTLVPFTFLYEVYVNWHAENGIEDPILGKTTFTDILLDAIRDDPVWYCPDKSRKIRPCDRMDAFEPLIVKYGMTKWMDPDYHGDDPVKRARPVLKAGYQGIQQRTAIHVNPIDLC